VQDRTEESLQSMDIDFLAIQEEWVVQHRSSCRKEWWMPHASCTTACAPARVCVCVCVCATGLE
jgi:hypothetical protein